MYLYSYYRSSAAFRVRIALNLKEIDYVSVPVNLLRGEHKSSEYLAVNPQGLVPALKVSGDQIITQSPAILEWLEENYPQYPLLPKDSTLRALTRSLASIVACDIHPICNLRVLNYLKSELNGDEDQKVQWIHHWIKAGFESIEGQLWDSRFALGDRASMADVYLVPQVYNALRFDVDMKQFPKVMGIYERCFEVPAFVSAMPEGQADAINT